MPELWPLANSWECGGGGCHALGGGGGAGGLGQVGGDGRGSGDAEAEPQLQTTTPFITALREASDKVQLRFFFCAQTETNDDKLRVTPVIIWA